MLLTIPSDRRVPLACRQWEVPSQHGDPLARKQPEGLGIQPPAVDGGRVTAATSPRRIASRGKSTNSHLENGHSTRHSDRMSTRCATATPTRHPPGEAHSLAAPASLMTTFAVGPLLVNRPSEVASRRLAAVTTGTRRPLSSPLPLSATPQLQPAHPLSNCVAKNAFGDTIRHATKSPRLDALPLSIRPTFSTTRRSRSVAVSANCRPTHRSEHPPLKQLVNCVARNASLDKNHQTSVSAASVIPSGARDLVALANFQIPRSARNDATVNG